MHLDQHNIIHILIFCNQSKAVEVINHYILLYQLNPIEYAGYGKSKVSKLFV